MSPPCWYRTGTGTELDSVMTPIVAKTKDSPASHTDSDAQLSCAGGEQTLTLSGIIRAILDETDLTTPEAVAAEAVRRTPDEHIREFYRQAVRGQARVQMHAIPSTPPAVTRSAKFAAIADMHSRQLKARVFVGDQWKMLGQCTYDDVLALADSRQQLAEENAAAAEKFRRVAKELQNAGAETVADLPADVLAAALAGAS